MSVPGNGKFLWRAILEDGMPKLQFRIGNSSVTMTLDVAQLAVMDIAKEISEAAEENKKHIEMKIGREVAAVTLDVARQIVDDINGKIDEALKIHEAHSRERHGERLQ